MVVNDVAKVNIDSKLVRERMTGGVDDADLADVVELQNGCACCNAADELLQVCTNIPRISVCCGHLDLGSVFIFVRL